MRLTNKEKEFTAEHAQQLYLTRNNKNRHLKVYKILNTFSKKQLKLNKLYTYKTPKGTFTLILDQTSRSTFDLDTFAIHHPKLFKKYTKKQKIVSACIDKLK